MTHLENVDFFIEEGASIELAASERFFLHNLDSIFFIEEGDVDVFFIEMKMEKQVCTQEQLENLIRHSSPLRANVIAGRSRFLFSRGKHQLLFPFQRLSELPNCYIFVSAMSNTILRSISLKKYVNYLANNGEEEKRISEHVLGWITDLSQIFNTNVLKQPDIYLKGGEILEVEAHKSLSFPLETLSEGHLKLVWVKVLSGRLHIQHFPTILLLPKDSIFPLIPSVVLESQELSTIEICKNLNWSSDISSWEGIFYFNACVIQALALQIHQRDLKEQQSLAFQVNFEKLQLEEAFQDMQTIFHTNLSLYRDISHQSQLYQACQVIGKHIGQSFRDDPSVNGLDANSQVQRISRQSFINQRKVYLPSEWWKKDSGPLLGRVKNKDKTTFIALLSDPPNGYFIVRPDGSKAIKVDEKIAKNISPEANVFYRGFPINSKISFANLLRFGLEHYKKELIVVAIAAVIATFFNLFTPFAFSIAFNYAIPYSDSHLLWQVILAMLMAGICSTIFVATREVSLVRLENYFYHDAEVAIWNRILDLPLSFFRKFSSGDFLARATGLHLIRKLLTTNTIQVTINAFCGIVYFAAMFYFSPVLAAVSFGLLLILFITYAITFMKTLKISTLQESENALLYNKYVQAVMGITKIRLEGAENRIFSSWEKIFLSIKRLEIQKGKINILNRLMFETLPGLSFLIIFTTLYMMEANFSSIQVGTYLAFSAAFSSFVLIIVAFQKAFLQFIDCIPIWRRMKPIFEETIEVSVENKFSVGALSGEVYLEQIYFRYDETAPFVLKNVSIRANPGEFIAVVGHSGSGKSTLTRLLLGFEKPERGSVYYNGRDLSELNKQDIRSQIGVVLQSSALLQGTLRENIAGGRLVTDEEIIKVLELASFGEDLANLPMGLSTPISGNLSLSGGQKQRVILARALLANPKILILDEATNALDNKTQDAVVRNLDQLHVTRIVIAHRLSTIKNAHRIYVLHEGCICQEGTYEELMSQGGLFSEFVERQRL